MADINSDSAAKEEKEMPPVDPSDSDEEVEDKEEETNNSEDVKQKKKEENEAKGEEDEAENEEDESDEEDEELPPGLLEQPLEVSGKREKKKVDRLSATMTVAQSAEKKKVEIEEGTGVKLGDIAFIEKQMNTTKAADLKSLHRLLFLRLGTQHEIKKNIRQFSGFTHTKESKEHEKRMAQLNKMHLAELKSICSVLALEKGGTKKDVVERIVEFLMKPVDKGIKVPQSKRAKNKAKLEAKSKKEKGKKRKRAPKQTKKKGKEEIEEDDESDDEDEEMSEQEIEEESEEEEEAPKKKKAKVEPKKKVSPKVNGKKENSPKKKEPKKAPPKAAKAAKEMSDLSDDSDSDNEPISKLIKPSPPSNDEIKALVKKILDGADLESVTMKTVVKEVYGKYPTFDLSDRKDFIKSTVRDVIS